LVVSYRTEAVVCSLIGVCCTANIRRCAVLFLLKNKIVIRDVFDSRKQSSGDEEHDCSHYHVKYGPLGKFPSYLFPSLSTLSSFSATSHSPYTFFPTVLPLPGKERERRQEDWRQFSLLSSSTVHVVRDTKQTSVEQASLYFNAEKIFHLLEAKIF